MTPEYPPPRLDILEMVAAAVDEGKFEAACLLLHRFVECSPGWTQPQQAMGRERVLWEDMVAHTNSWKHRYYEECVNPEELTPQALHRLTEKMRWWLAWHKIVFNGKERDRGCKSSE